MSRGRIRGAPLPGSWVWLVASILILAAAHPVRCQQPTAGGPQAAGDQVRCPHCDEKGKVACKRCGGTGDLTRPCRLCGGTGERPCPQCAKKRNGNGQNGATPGQVPCPYCGGRGHLGNNSQKTCPQCLGAQLVQCPSCRGKGSFACAETRFAGICPDCGKTGKVTCKVCNGTRLVSPSALRAPLPRGDVGGHKGPSNGGVPGEGKAPPGEQDPARQGKDKGADLQQRYEELEECYTRYDSLFSRDLPAEVEGVERGARELQRQIKAVSPGPTPSMVADLTEIRNRVEHLVRRWGEIGDIYGRFQHSYLACRKEWEKGPGEGTTSNLGPSAPRFDPVEVRVNICGNLSRQLEGEKPAWLLRESGEIQQRWKVMHREGGELVAALEKKAEEARKAKEAQEAAEKSDSGKPDAKRSPGGARLTSPGTPHESGSPDGGGSSGRSVPTKVVTPQREQEKPTTPPATTRTATTRTAAATGDQDPPPAEQGLSFGALLFRGFLWLGSVLVAAYLLVTARRWLRRGRASSREDAWAEFR